MARINVSIATHSCGRWIVEARNGEVLLTTFADHAADGVCRTHALTYAEAAALVGAVQLVTAAEPAPAPGLVARRAGEP